MQQEVFDPYRKWLGIAPKDQPPNHYRLLGVDLYESDPDVIANAADQRMTHVRTFQTGPNASASQKILNELSAAKICLLDEERRAGYEAELREQLEAASSPQAAQPAAPRRMPARPAAARWSNGSNGDGAANIDVAPAAAAQTNGRTSASRAALPSRHGRSKPNALPWLIGIGGVGAVVIGVLALLLGREKSPSQLSRPADTANAPAAGAPATAKLPVTPQPKPAPPQPPRSVVPPQIVALPQRAVRAGDALEFDVGLTAPAEPGRRVRYELLSAPTGASIDGAGRFRFRPEQHATQQLHNVKLRAAWIDNPAVASDVDFRIQVLPRADVQPTQISPIFRPPGQKLAAPPEAEFAAQLARINTQYATELGDTSREGRLKLANTLRTEAMRENDLPRRYALLSKAIKLATQGGDANAAWQSIDLRDMTFQGDSIAAKAEVLTQTADPSGNPQSARNTAQLYYQLLQQAQWSGRFVAGEKLIEPAGVMANLAQDPGLKANIDLAAGSLRELAREEEAADKARAALAANPNDADANYRLGRYLCLMRNDYSTGLPLLARGSNEAYKDAATVELAKPADIAARLQAGDQWWLVQQQESPAVQRRAMQRVLYWYSQVRNEVDGKRRDEVHNRIGTITAALASATRPVPVPIKPNPDKPNADPPVVAKPVPEKPVEGQPVVVKPPEKPTPEKPTPEKPTPEKPIARPTPKPGPSQPELKPLTAEALSKLVRGVLQRGGRIRLMESSSWIYKEEELPGEGEWIVAGLALEKEGADETMLRMIGRLPKLQSLTLNCSALNDAGVHRLSELTQLTRIELTSPRISDRCVSALDKMTELTSVTLRGGEQLGGANIDVLATLPKLMSLELSGGKISEGTLAAVGKLESLRSLSLKDGRYSTRGIDRLQSLTKLTDLSLKSFSINDQVVSHLAQLKSLKRLTLEGPINGSTLAALAELSQLESLSINSNDLEEKDLTPLMQLAGLRRLTLKTKPLSNGFLEKLSALKNLETLDIQTRGGFNEPGLKHLDGLPKLKSAHLAGLDISIEGYAKFRAQHPDVNLTPHPDWGDKLREWGKGKGGSGRGRPPGR